LLRRRGKRSKLYNILLIHSYMSDLSYKLKSASVYAMGISHLAVLGLGFMDGHYMVQGNPVHINNVCWFSGASAVTTGNVCAILGIVRDGYRLNNFSKGFLLSLPISALEYGGALVAGAAITKLDEFISYLF